ncbi:MAG: ribosomal protein L7/L12 [Planctomycetota bacterium]|jgi:ribosomal protein L7/L12
MDDLAKQIADLLVAGKKIEAIKLLREATGLGLAEAVRAVEAAEQGDALPWLNANGPIATANESTLPDDVAHAAANGNRIAAIKLLREHKGLGLKEAKDEIDRAFPIAEQPGATAKRGCLLPLLFGMAATAIVLPP